MQYEKTKITPTKTADVNKAVAKKLDTSQLLWIVITRHKFGISVTLNIILLINWIFPPAFDIIRQLITLG